jgi:CRP/FNR family transcriptional regulator, anaerobic regulatory protein
MASNISMTAYTILIKNITRNETVNESQLTEILERFSLRKIKKKTMLIREGTICNEFYFINQGMIRTFIYDDGNEVTTWVALPGTIETSAQSFIRQTPSLVNLQAVNDCELLVMNRQDYYHLLNNNKTFNSFAIQMLENFYLRVEDKFYSYLFLSAADRFRKMKAQFPQHFKEVPLKYLASILRVKPETLSRLRKKIAKNT